jgi:16S rRNA processing protein RimM
MSVWSELALVGRIARAHGHRGQVIVNPETDFPEDRFLPGAVMCIEHRGAVEALTLTAVRFQNGRPVIAIEGVETMNDAQALSGLELRVDRDSLRALPDGTFYRHDLIGCRVETRAGAPVGIVEDVEGAIGGSRLVVAGTDGRGEVLIPLAAEICPVIDPAAKLIVIDPPDGLLEANVRSAGGRALERGVKITDVERRARGAR